MSEKFRCSVCNKVDAQDIETEIGDFICDGFYPDPTDGNKSMCKECLEWHMEIMSDYESRDDVWGWEEQSGFEAFEYYDDEVTEETVTTVPELT